LAPCPSHGVSDVAVFQPGLPRLAAGLGDQYVELRHTGSGDRLKDDNVILADDDKLRTWSQLKAFADFFGDDNLAF